MEASAPQPPVVGLARGLVGPQGPAPALLVHQLETRLPRFLRKEGEFAHEKRHGMSGLMLEVAVHLEVVENALWIVLLAPGVEMILVADVGPSVLRRRRQVRGIPAPADEAQVTSVDR